MRAFDGAKNLKRHSVSPLCLALYLVAFSAFCFNYARTEQLMPEELESRYSNDFWSNQQFNSNAQKFVTKNTEHDCSGPHGVDFRLNRLGADRFFNLTNKLDLKLLEVLRRQDPDFRPSRDAKEIKDITLDVALNAWRHLFNHTKSFVTRKVNCLKSDIERLLSDARVSPKCYDSVRVTLDASTKLHSWALKLANSWGNFPMSGIFEGTYGDVGSFRTCVDIKSVPEIGHAHYCTITFRPVLPSIKDYELVVRKERKELLNLFNSPNEKGHDRIVFSDILDHVQYNHYVYYKLGTCWPIGCSPVDVRKVVRLLSLRNVLAHGPVKCYSMDDKDYEEKYDLDDSEQQHHQVISGSRPATNSSDPASSSRNKIRRLVVSTWDKNNGIFVWKPHFYTAHRISLAVVVSITCFILALTALDLVINRVPVLWTEFRWAMGARRLVAPGKTMDDGGCELQHSPALNCEMAPTGSRSPRSRSLLATLISDCSVITNAAQFFRVSEGQMRNDILCLNGLRCLTMIWILMTHTMLYNDWSGFGRTREVEKALKSLLNQPLFNGSYLVDTFFLISGLLSAFTAFRQCQGLSQKFNSFAYILGRWLRLTPQIFLVSLFFILVPTASSGPHWFAIVGEYSENCQENWWINILHLQAFYKQSEMCNFVTWWISIDFFYHFYALALIWLIFMVKRRRKSAAKSISGDEITTNMTIGEPTGEKLETKRDYIFWTVVTVIMSHVAYQAYRHYQLKLPPNILSTIPQTGAMWTELTLNFFWKPYSHAIPFFSGFYLGYLMAMKPHVIEAYLNTRVAFFGWFLSLGLLLTQSYSTYWWVIGEAGWTQLTATIFYTICPFAWSGSLCWIIVACRFNYGGFINRFLSCKTFIILSKASYLVYLSHFQVLFFFFGNQNFLLEPSELVMLYIVAGNIMLSTVWGIVLCITYELPWLKFQRRLMKYF